MVIETLVLLIAILLAVVVAQVVSHRRWSASIDVQLADAAAQVAWWRKRALTPAPVRPPDEPFWSRAATVCAPVYQAPRF